MYQTTSPILFIIYNRPDLVNIVFEEIRKVKPQRLYIAADGPSSKKNNDSFLCEEARSITHKIDWECEIKTLFREQNAGCKIAVSSAINWFFEQEEMGIILEDDCLPSVSFFSFCDELLEKYKNDTRIRLISGCNLQHGQKHGEASYYFSNLTHVWGWASWQRVWKEYAADINHYEFESTKQALKNIFEESLIVDSWMEIVTQLQQNKIDTWDYQFALLNFLNNGLSIIPNVNLIKNIGFRNDATHTSGIDNKNANLPLHNINSITHPTFITPQKKADMYTLLADFHVEERKKNKKRSFKNKLKDLFK
jgi:hypothetical protein